MDRKTIIDKVVKLLSLSNNNDNEHQAQAAKNKAAELMAQYDISIHEAKEPPEYIKVEKALKRKKPIPYDSSLLKAVSNFNGVALLFAEGFFGPAKYIYIGSEADLEVNDYMIDIVLQQRTYAWKDYAKRFKLKYGESPSQSIRIDWMRSYAAGLHVKLLDLQSMKDKKVQEHGLVPVDRAMQARNKFYDESQLRKSKSRAVGANVDGYMAGKNTAIHKGIKEKGKTKFIGG